MSSPSEILALASESNSRIDDICARVKQLSRHDRKSLFRSIGARASGRRMASLGVHLLPDAPPTAEAEIADSPGLHVPATKQLVKLLTKLSEEQLYTPPAADNNDESDKKRKKPHRAKAGAVPGRPPAGAGAGRAADRRGGDEGRVLARA